MAQQKHEPEELVAKLRQVDVLVSQGQSVAEAVRSIGVTQLTYSPLTSRARLELSKALHNAFKRLRFPHRPDATDQLGLPRSPDNAIAGKCGQDPLMAEVLRPRLVLLRRFTKLLAEPDDGVAKAVRIE
jgi:hypothetical protein